MLENRNKTLAKNTIILGIGQLIPKFIALITLPILTKYLSTESYGVYDLILSLASLALPILTLLLQQAAFRFLIDSSRDKRKTITNTFFAIGCLFIFWLFIIIIATIFKPYSVQVIWMVFILYVTESLYDSAGQIIRGLGNNLQYSVGVIIYSVLNMVLLLGLLYSHSISVLSIVLISAVGYLIGFLYLCTVGHIFSFISPSFASWIYMKEMLQYSLPIIPSSIALWVVNLSDRLLVIAFLGSSINGIYAAANKIPNLCGTAYSVFNLAWTENASRTSDDDDRNQYYSHLFNSLFAFMVGAVMVLMILSPIFYDILIDNKFSRGIEQMPPLFLGILFSCMVSFLGGIYVGLKKTKQVGISSAVGAGINLLINLLLIKRIGLFAASISTVVSFFLIFVYRIVDLKNYVGLEYDKKMFVLSFIGLIIITILFYLDLTALYIGGTFICLIYNYLFNRTMITHILKKVKH